MQISISKGGEEPREADELKNWLRRRAFAEGFAKFGITVPAALRASQAHLYSFLEAGFHGEMGWLAANREKRADPEMLWSEVRSIVMLGFNYAPPANPLAALEKRSNAIISVYAQGADYHDVIKAKLKSIGGEFARHSGAEVKLFVDTAPVMEKPLAQAAGIGWQGKHTNLVARDFGSWLFIGAIFTNAALPPDAPEANHCGACRRCLDICPTSAFPAPYRMDARRCISYLTIEHKSQIPREFRGAIGNRVYGCDDCLAVCPWNKFAQQGQETRFAARPSADNPPLAELLALDDAAFRARFSGSPIKRIGRNRFLRNALIATGNSGDLSLLPLAIRLLGDASPLVRGMAVWAVARLLAGDEESYAQLKAQHYPGEADGGVREEWDMAAA
jgi:epoxyqueuosine reductase